jgi:hypothetical protein
MTTPYRSPEARCASCNAQIVAAEAYLSGSGPVCEPCHKQAAMADRQRSLGRESNTDALLGGIFASLSGLALAGLGMFSPEIPVRPTAIAMAVIVTAVVRVPRMHTTAAHGTVGKRLVAVGAVLGGIGLLVLVARVVAG